MIRYGGVVAVLAWLVGCGPAQTKPEVDPCLGVVCGEGRCALVDGAPACLCAEGFRAVGLSCVALPVADLCASNPCSGLSNSVCLVNGGTVSCVCPATRVEVNGSCVPRTACVPNPCQQPRRTTCESVGGVASCRCDPGYAPEGEGCSPAPVWTCAQQHADGDSAEADECPTLARPLFIDLTESRTLMPSGDHDWFDIGITPGRLFSFSATSTTTALLIEVFDPTGVTLLASDNRGVSQAEVAFVAPAFTSLLVRVRGVRATDTGGYFASYRELGVDDYVNTSAGAVTLVPGAAPFAGVLQYAGDLDVVWLELPAQTAVRLALPDAGTPELLVEVSRPDGGGSRLINAGEVSVIAAPAVEALVLTARGRNPRNLGAFALSLDDLGPDDHSDEPAFGTPLLSDNVPVAGLMQRTGDVDSFRVAQLTGRLYRARWQAGSSGSSITGTVLDANGQLLGATSYGSSTGQVWKAGLSRPAAVRVQPYYSYPGPTLSYTVAVEDLGFDDHSDELGNATPLTQGVPAAGRLELPTDVDTFSFTATAGRIFNVTATNTTTGNTSLQHLRVVDSVGGLVGEGDGTVGVLIGATGTYKVAVSRGSYGTGDLITYTVVVTDQGADDHAGTSSGATTLTLGTAASGSVQYQADVDAFAFSSVANHLYEVTCTRAAGTCSFVIKDPAGVAVYSSSYSSSAGVVLAATSGRWVVEVNGGSSYSSTLGPYSLTVSDLGLEDHGATIATATAVTLGTATAGRIGYSQDVDVFSFPVVAGRIYGAQATPSNMRVELRTSANVLIASANYNGGASAIAPATGTLYAFVSNYSLTNYTLSVEDRGADDHPNTVTGATALTVGTAATGDIQYQGDLDFFTVPVTTGHHHQVTCVASSGSCSITVQDSLGTTIATTYGSSTTVLAFKPPPAATAVFIRVSTSTSYETMRYSVVVADLGADDHGDLRADATALVIDAAATAGVLETGSDVDAFTVTPSSGEVVLVTCTTTAGTACGLLVTSPAGSTLTQTSPAPLSRTAFISTGGAWLVQVRPNSGGSSGSPGSYTLQTSRSSDDFASTSALTLGTPQAGTIDYVGDTDAFSIQLTAGTVTRATLTGTGYGVRGTITSPGGGYLPSLYSGSTSTFTPSVSGTYIFTIASDAYYGAPASYTLTVQ